MAINSQNSDETLASELVALVSTNGIGSFRTADPQLKRASARLLKSGIDIEDRLLNWGYSPDVLQSERLANQLMSQHTDFSSKKSIGKDWNAEIATLFKFSVPQFRDFSLPESVAMEVIALLRRSRGFESYQEPEKSRSQTNAIRHFGEAVLARRMSADESYTSNTPEMEFLEEILEEWSAEDGESPGLVSPLEREKTGLRRLIDRTANRSKRMTGQWDNPKTIATVLQHDPIVRSLIAEDSKDTGVQSADRFSDMVNAITSHPLFNGELDSLPQMQQGMAGPGIESGEAFINLLIVENEKSLIQSGRSPIAQERLSKLARQSPALRNMQFTRELVGDGPNTALVSSVASELLASYESGPDEFNQSSLSDLSSALRQVAVLQDPRNGPEGRLASLAPSRVPMPLGLLQQRMAGATRPRANMLQTDFGKAAAMGRPENRVAAERFIQNLLTNPDIPDFSEPTDGGMRVGREENAGFTLIQKLESIVNDSPSPLRDLIASLGPSSAGQPRQTERDMVPFDMAHELVANLIRNEVSSSPNSLKLPIAAQAATGAEMMSNQILGDLGFEELAKTSFPSISPLVDENVWTTLPRLKRLEAEIQTFTDTVFQGGTTQAFPLEGFETNIDGLIGLPDAQAQTVKPSDLGTPSWAKGTEQANLAWVELVSNLGFISPKIRTETAREFGFEQTGENIRTENALLNDIFARQNNPGGVGPSVRLTTEKTPDYAFGLERSLDLSDMIMAAPWQTATTIGALEASMPSLAGDFAIDRRPLNERRPPDGTTQFPNAPSGKQDFGFPALMTPAMNQVFSPIKLELSPGEPGIMETSGTPTTAPRWRIGQHANEAQEIQSKVILSAEGMTQIEGLGGTWETNAADATGIAGYDAVQTQTSVLGLGLPSGLVGTNEMNQDELPMTQEGLGVPVKGGGPLLSPHQTTSPAQLFSKRDGSKMSSIFMIPESPSLVTLLTPSNTQVESPSIPQIANSARAASTFQPRVEGYSREATLAQGYSPPPVIQVTPGGHDHAHSPRAASRFLTFISPGSPPRVGEATAKDSLQGSRTPLRLLKRLEPGLGLWGESRSGVDSLPSAGPFRGIGTTRSGDLIWTALTPEGASPEGSKSDTQAMGWADETSQPPVRFSAMPNAGPPLVSFSRDLIEQQERGLSVVGGDRIFGGSAGENESSTMLGSDSLNYVLGIPQEESGEEFEGELSRDLMSSPDTEWIHPGLVPEREETAERVLVDPSPNMSSTTGSSAEDGGTTFDVRTLEQMKPRVTSASMGSAVAQSAMLSEDSPSDSPSAASGGEQKEGDEKQKIDLDALATELAGRIRNKMQRMNERTGRW